MYGEKSIGGVGVIEVTILGLAFVVIGCAGAIIGYLRQIITALEAKQ